MCKNQERWEMIKKLFQVDLREYTPSYNLSALMRKRYDECRVWAFERIVGSSSLAELYDIKNTIVLVDGTVTGPNNILIIGNEENVELVQRDLKKKIGAEWELR